MNNLKLMNVMQLLVAMTAMCFSTLTSAAINVNLEVYTAAGGEQALRVAAVGNDSPCGGGSPSNSDCIEVGKGKTPHIFFNLKKACEQDAGGNPIGPEYGLTEVRITMVNKVWPSAGNPLNAVVVSDFNANPDTGVVKLKKKKPWKLKLKNFNSHAYTVFYQITAEHCTDGNADDIHLDPQIRNTGSY